jgi:hypothetical protein
VKALARRFGRLALVATLVCAVPAYAQRGAPDEYTLKAAYLYAFAKYVEWPEGAFANEAAPMVICIVGEDPFKMPDGAENKLERAVRDKKVRGHPFQVMLVPSSTAATLNRCHILFVSRTEQAGTADLLRRLAAQPVLTVSEQEDFTKGGGCIAFVSTARGFTVALNALAVERQGLKASTELQAVATADNH